MPRSGRSRRSRKTVNGSRSEEVYASLRVGLIVKLKAGPVFHRWNFQIMELSYHGTFVPRNLRSLELSFP